MRAVFLFILTAIAFSGFSTTVPATGYIITYDGDTLSALVMVEFSRRGELDREEMQYQVFVEVNGEKKGYSAGNLKGYGYQLDTQVVHMVAMINDWSEYNAGQMEFVELRLDGKCRLYYHYERGITPGYNKTSILEKKKVQYFFLPNKLPVVNNLRNGFKLKDFFSDCETVSSKLSTKGYGRDPVALANDYNAACGN